MPPAGREAYVMPNPFLPGFFGKIDDSDDELFYIAATRRASIIAGRDLAGIDR